MNKMKNSLLIVTSLLLAVIQCAALVRQRTIDGHGTEGKAPYHRDKNTEGFFEGDEIKYWERQLSMSVSGTSPVDDEPSSIGDGGSKTNVFRHSFYLRFDNGTDQESIDNVVNCVNALPDNLTSVKNLQWGINNSPEGIDDGFTHSFLMTLQSEADMEDRAVYWDTPAHQECMALLELTTYTLFVFDYDGLDPSSSVVPELKHAVYFKFFDDAPVEEVDQAVETLLALESKIDTIEGLEWGLNKNPQYLQGYGDNFTHVFMVTFDSEEDRDAYLPNPDHVAFTSLLPPIMEKARVIDFWDQTEKPADVSGASPVSDEPGSDGNGGSKTNVFRHSFYLRFDNGTDQESIDNVVNCFNALPDNLTSVKNLQWGINNSPEGIDDGFTHSFLMTLQSEADMEDRAVYWDTPAHQECMALLELTPYTLFVFDYDGLDPSSSVVPELKHAVYFKFFDDAPVEEVDQAVETLLALETKIDTIEGLEWGLNKNPKYLQGYGDNFTHVFMVTFGSEEDRDAYLPNPDHLAFTSLLPPIMEQVRVIDFWDQTEKPADVSGASPVSDEPGSVGNGGSKTNVFRHSFYLRFDNGTDQESIDNVVNCFNALPDNLTSVKNLQWGINNSPEGIDDGFTHSFLMTLQSEADMEDRAVYWDTPAHQECMVLLELTPYTLFVFDYDGLDPSSSVVPELKHAVYFKFFDDAPVEEVDQAVETLLALETKIDTIEGLEWGLNKNPQYLQGYGDNFTHVFMVTFGSEEDRDAYLPNPDHLAFTSLLPPIMEKVRVIDFWDQTEKPAER